MHKNVFVFMCNAMQRVVCRKATLDELQSCHSEAYTLRYGSHAQKVDPRVFGKWTAARHTLERWFMN